MKDAAPYEPPRIWTPPASSGGRFANINRPTAGPTHEKELPVGRHPLQLYSLATPNGVKVTVMLEELLALGHAGAEYDAWLIRIQEGDQFGSGFVAVNPNSKIPALWDRSGTSPIRVFESGAILVYLAEKFGAFLPTDQAQTATAVAELLRAHAISTQTAVAMLVAAGFPIADARAEVERIYAEDTEAAKNVADALNSEQAAADRLGVELPQQVVAAPVVNLPPAGQ